MAASGHYRATYGGGFRLGYAAAGGRALSHNREGAGGPRQPKHSQPGLVVQGVRAGGSQAPVAPAGVPPHPQARLLAEHGGDRALGALSAVFGASHPRCREAYKGDWGLGAQAQRRRGDGAMALHGIRRSGEAGTPLSAKPEWWSTSSTGPFRTGNHLGDRRRQGFGEALEQAVLGRGVLRVELGDGDRDKTFSGCQHLQCPEHHAERQPGVAGGVLGQGGIREVNDVNVEMDHVALGAAFKQPERIRRHRFGIYRNVFDRETRQVEPLDLVPFPAGGLRAAVAEEHNPIRVDDRDASRGLSQARLAAADRQHVSEGHPIERAVANARRSVQVRVEVEVQEPDIADRRARAGDRADPDRAIAAEDQGESNRHLERVGDSCRRRPDLFHDRAQVLGATVCAVRSPRPRWRVAEIGHGYAGVGQSLDEPDGAELGGCLVLSDAAGAGSRWNPDEGDLSRHATLAPRAFLRACPPCQMPHARPWREPVTAILATDKLLSHEVLGTFGTAHPQRDGTSSRLEDHLEGKERAALPLGDDEAHQLLGPLRPSLEDKLVAVFELATTLVAGKQLARELLPALVLPLLGQPAGDRYRRTFCFGSHAQSLLFR